MAARRLRNTGVESRAVFPNLFSFEAPLRSIIDIWRHPWLSFLGIKIKELQLLAAPLAPAYSTLVCRGTLVGNHCIKV